MAVTDREVREVQRALNAFTDKRLAYVEPLRVDGDKGAATNKRIRECRFYLGYVKSQRTHGEGDDIDAQLLWRLSHPKRTNKRWGFKKADVVRGIKRRLTQRKHAHRDRYKAKRSGVGTFDDKPCANWLIPYLRWARDNGWPGRLNSGWRSPEYSEHLCFAMCGAPSCPGRCAGRTTNHAKDDKPDGAVDVTFYDDFGVRMRHCPLEPHILNALGAQDPVHFSSSGR